MSKNTALAAIVVGVLANNYVYLHDIVMQKHDGLIHIGMKSSFGIAVAVIVIVIGARALAGGWSTGARTS